MALIYLPLIALIFYWRLKVFKSGNISKGKAIGLYALWALAPLFLYALIFFGLVGIEEITDFSIIGEGYARTLPIVIAGGMALTIITTLLFTILIYALKWN